MYRVKTSVPPVLVHKVMLLPAEVARTKVAAVT
jgi:hypothetical protein